MSPGKLNFPDVQSGEAGEYSQTEEEMRLNPGKG